MRGCSLLIEMNLVNQNYGASFEVLMQNREVGRSDRFIQRIWHPVFLTSEELSQLKIFVKTDMTSISNLSSFRNPGCKIRKIKNFYSSNFAPISSPTFTQLLLNLCRADL